MKIGITTVQHGTSFGSNLQAYALSRFLRESFPCEVEFIDYLSEASDKAIQAKEHPKGLKAHLKWIRDSKTRKQYLSKLSRFESFAEKHYKRTERFPTYRSVVDANLDHQVFITGSDQVFRVNKPDEAWLVNYLSFCPSGAKKIAYAASFGDEVIPDSRINEVKRLLGEFSGLSCREEAGSELIERTIGVYPPVVCDPVFLLSASEWEALAVKPNGVPDEYILVYSLLNQEYMGELIDRVAKMTGLRVVVIDACNPSRYTKYQVLYDIGPEDFIGLFMGASFVITNSFHGTSFSTIFRKNFFTYRVKGKGFITRAKCLLERFGIGDRIVDEHDDIQIDDLKLDYSTAESRILTLIAESKAFIQEKLAN